MQLKRFARDALLLGLAVLGSIAHAGEEDTNARLRELVHRTQEALRQAQSDNADLTHANTELEQKLKAATQQAEAAESGKKAAAASMHAQLTAAETTRADLTRKLGEAGQQLAATGAKLSETQQQLAAREAELTQLKQGLEQSKAANASCEDKNLKLYTYAQELLQAYRKKGVWAALAQKDPVLGLKEVDIENVVQEYQLKLASQKVKP